MKKFYFLIFSILILSTCTAFAGVSIDWLRSIDGHPESGAAIARDASNNTYATGKGSVSIYLTKRDHFGNFQWEVSSTSILGEIPVRVFVDPQGNPVIVGFRFSTLHEGPFAVSLIVLKYDPSGTLIYKKTIDGTYSYHLAIGGNVTKVTAQMDGAGNVYIGTGGIVNGFPNQGFNVIKVSSGGNILWVRTQTFGISQAFGSPQFYLVSNIRLMGNKLGLVGPIKHSQGDPGIWVLDTTGTTTWSLVSTGGVSNDNDITRDNIGNFFVLTTRSNIAGANTGLDIGLYKFNPTGTQLWLKGYDFGKGEIGLRIELTPDNNLAIMGFGQQINGGLTYIDWLTLKVDLNGTLLWGSRYDHTINNDERPRMMLVDAQSNVYVTGNGGPCPDVSDLGALQGVTLKYSPTGILQWTALLDTLDFNGVDIALGSDASLFVISAGSPAFPGASAVVHYLQSSGTISCSVPVNLSATGITSAAAAFSWSAVPGAASYNVHYRVVGTTTWTTATTTTTSLNAAGLTANTNYEWQVQTVCSGGNSSFTPSATFTTAVAAACNAPTGMTTANITSSSATFSWSASGGATSYNVRYRIVGTTTWTTGTTVTTSFNAAGLTANTNYEWQVQTVCSGGNSLFNTSTTFTTVALATCSNIALGKTATASSSSGSNTPNLVVDGNASTFWRSSSGGTQYLQVDFGASAYNYRQVTINWRSIRHAKSFQIRVSNSASFSTYTTVFSTTTGTGGNQTISLTGTPRSERYIRLYMTRVNSSYYAVNEFEVCGFSTGQLKQAAGDFEVTAATILTEPTLFQNYPNPFNQSTIIQFYLPTEVLVTLNVYDMRGKEIAKLVNERRSAGVNTVIFDATNLPEGVYIAILQTNKSRIVQKLFHMN